MNNEIALLIGQAKKTKEILEQNFQFYSDFKKIDYEKLGQSIAAAMVFSQIYIDFYTCIETLFFRISQTFENNLLQEKWHKHLLEKMAIEIDGVRPAVLNNNTYLALDELLRFRHFRRYYFNFDYDWDKLNLIEKKYNKLQHLLISDINNFITFLEKLKE